MNDLQKEILATSATGGVVAGLLTSDPLLGAIIGAGTAVTMDAAYNAAVEELKQIAIEEASRARTISVPRA